MYLRHDTQAINVFGVLAIIGALLIVGVSVVFLVTRQVPIVSCSMTIVITNGTQGGPVLGVAVWVARNGVTLQTTTTDIFGKAPFNGLPCAQVAFQYGGGAWVKSDPEIVQLVPGPLGPTFTRPVFSCTNQPCS